MQQSAARQLPEIRLCVPPSKSTSIIEVLRRPVESAALPLARGAYNRAVRNLVATTS
jgi:hypothetical protein